MVKKLSINDNDFLVAIRRNDFVKAVASKKLADEHFKIYRPVLNSKVRLFWNTNQKLCGAMSMSIDDVRQMANCWMVNWVGLHETTRPEVENKKLFHVYLRQRFARFKSILDRKLRSSDLNAMRYFDESDEVEPVSLKDLQTRGRVASFKTRRALSSLSASQSEAKLLKVIKSNKDPEVVEAAKKHLERIRQAIA